MDDLLKNINEIVSSYNNASDLFNSDKSRKILEEQKNANNHLLQLRYQLEKANKANAEILRLQIIEYEKKIEQKYFKALAFFLLQQVNYLKEIEDALVLYYLLNREQYYDKIRNALITCNDILEEIPDKLFAAETISKLDQIKSDADKHRESFERSSLYEIDDLIKDFEIQSEKHNNSKEPPFIPMHFARRGKSSNGVVLGYIFSIILIVLFLSLTLKSFSSIRSDQEIINGFMFLLFLTGAVFLLFFVVRLQRKESESETYKEYLVQLEEFNKSEQKRKEESKRAYDTKVKEEKERLLKHPMYDCMRNIYDQFPDFFAAKKQLVDYEKKFSEKMKLSGY